MRWFSIRPMKWVRRCGPLVIVCSIWVILAIGFLTQAVYALWLHASDPCEGYIYDASCSDKLNFFFGNEEAEGVAALMAVALSVGVSLAWVSFQIRFVLPSVWRRSRAYAAGRGLRGLAAEVAGRVARIVRMLFPDDDDGPDARRVRREFEKQRVRRAMSMVHRVCPFFVGFLLFIVYQSFFSKLGTMPIWGSFRDLHWTYVFGTGGVPLLAMVVPTVIADMCPSSVTPLHMDSANVLLSSVWAWKLAVSYKEAYTFHQHWLTVTRLLQVFMLGNARLSVVLNAVIFFVDAANTFIRPEGASPRLWVFYRDTLVFMGISTLTLALERFQRSEARLLVQAQKSDRTTALVGQVLSRACDAVPQLDAELRLTGPCPDLGALLLREGRIPSGSSFLDLIWPEDRGLFRQSLAGPAPTPALSSKPGDAARTPEPGVDEGAAGAAAFAGLCHLRMQAAMNEQIKVSVFYSCVPDPDGMPTYLLGIREDREEGTAPTVALYEPPGPVADRLALASLPEAQATVSDDRSSSAWSSVGSDGEGAEDGDLTAWVDAMSDEWKVLTCSRSFALLGGAGGQCRNLYEWISSNQVNDIANIVDWEDRTKHVKVMVCPPGQGKYTCKVKLGPHSTVFPEQANQDTYPVLLTFKVRKVHTQSPQQEWDTTREVMAQARKKNAGGAIQQAAGAANSVRQGAGQPLPALSAASEPSGPRSAATSALPHAIPDSSAVSEPSTPRSMVAQL